ncbi:MAG: hypothetical protein RIQ53_815 [Pseudomonadota bacterium]|jgi:SAM-dependent methyltransferase
MSDPVQPTVLVDHFRAAAQRAADGNAYQGLQVHALAGLHPYLAGQVQRWFQPGARLIDLAAGSGAMCRRLADLGYRPTGVDYVGENFRPRDIPFRQCDLNQDFAPAFAGEGIAAILASEIIEHLENPRHFARQCHALLPPGGRLILTTPNVDSPASVMVYARTGMHLWFNDVEYRNQGHISPLSQWQIGKAFGEAGFRTLWQGSFGAGHSLVEGSRLKRTLARAFARFSRLPADLRGEIYVAVFERPAAPDAPISPPDAAAAAAPSAAPRT